MSLWTPGGEHQVPRDQPEADRPGTTAGQDPSSAAPPGGPDAGSPVDERNLLANLSPEDRAQLESMSPEERARATDMLREMVDVQQQMAETPAAHVVANHAMGLYELATIHLRQQPPNFPEAQVAIDGFAALVGALKGKMGPDEPTLNDALRQIEMAFVQLKGAAGGETGSEGEVPPTEAP